ncbi:MAG: bactofilin family protein [Wenzhouxiangellaceae bacterium]
MAIFGKDRARQDPGHGTTIIAADSELVGNLTLSDDLHVDGRTEGDIASKATVVVGSPGRIKGRINARNVIVSGRVEGTIEAERLEIVSGGSVEGKIHTVDLVIEPGGRFNGSSELLDTAGRESSPAPASRARTTPEGKKGSAADSTEPGNKTRDPAAGHVSTA